MDIDDLVNGLPTRPVPRGNRKRSTPRQSQPQQQPQQRARRLPQARPSQSRQSVPDIPTEPPPKARPGYKHYCIPRWLFWVLLICSLGSMWAMNLAERGPDNPAWNHTQTQPPAGKGNGAAPAPGATVTVTVTATETVEVLPASCREAIRLMRSIIEDVNLLNSKSMEQLDIASDANQAIFMKDWAKLRDVQGRQRDLMQRQQTAYQDYKSKYKPALDALAQCEKDGK